MNKSWCSRGSVSVIIRIPVSCYSQLYWWRIHSWQNAWTWRNWWLLRSGKPFLLRRASLGMISKYVAGIHTVLTLDNLCNKIFWLYHLTYCVKEFFSLLPRDFSLSFLTGSFSSSFYRLWFGFGTISVGSLSVKTDEIIS